MQGIDKGGRAVICNRMCCDDELVWLEMYVVISGSMMFVKELSLVYSTVFGSIMCSDDFSGDVEG